MRTESTRVACAILLGIVGCESKVPPVAPVATVAPVSDTDLLQGVKSVHIGTEDPVVPAVLSGRVQKTAVLGSSPEWTDVPDFLHGTKIQSLPLDQTPSHTFLLKVDAPGILVAASGRIKKANGYENPHELGQTLGVLRSQGWRPIGYMTSHEDRPPVRYTVFRRTVKAGEEIKFQTGYFQAPTLVILEPSHIKGVAEVLELMTTVNDLTHLSIPPIQLGVPGQESTSDTYFLTAHDPRLPTIAAPLLQQELIRQALWMSSVEEFELPIRDYSLGEAIPRKAVTPGRTLGVLTSREMYEKILIATIIRHDANRYEPLWEQTFPMSDFPRVEEFAGVCEGLSRKEFVVFLKEQGLKPRSHPKLATVALPQFLDDRLLQFNLFTQIGLIRELHTCRETQGESAEVLGGLARAYANLSTITDYLYSPVHRVYQARALLYAERAVGQAPDDARGVWTRAYVRALLGLHAAALADLRLAEERLQAPAKGQGPSQAPEWGPLLKSFCTFQRAELGKVQSDQRLAQLANHLILISKPYATKDPRQLKVAKSLRESTPENLLAGHALNESDPFVTGGSRLPEVWHAVAKGIADLPDAPQEAREFCRTALKEDSEEVVVSILGERGRLREILRDESRSKVRPTIPSQLALDHLIGELAFEASASHAFFVGRVLATPADDTVQKLAPLISGHPLALYLQAFIYEPKARRASADQLLGMIDPSRLDDSAINLLNWLVTDCSHKDRAEVLMQFQQAHRDVVFRDLVRYLVTDPQPDPSEPPFQQLEKISPHAPELALYELRFRGFDVPSKAEIWEKQFESDPRVQEALGRRYVTARRWPDAERCLLKAMQLGNSASTRMNLSFLYQLQSKWDEAAKILEEGFDAESVGLELSQMREMLAELLMNRGMWKEALPYALKAAESGSNAGMRSAQLCYEGLGDLAKSEELVRARSERYQGERLQWYLWCRRTGRGDQASAQALAEEYISRLLDDLPMNDVLKVATYYSLTGKSEDALRICEAAAYKYKFPYFWLQAAAARSSRGERTAAIELVGHAPAGPTFKDALGNDRNAIIRCAELLREFLKDPNADTLSEAAIDNIHKEPGSLDADMDYVHWFVGQFLWHHQERDLAIVYLRRVANSHQDTYARDLAVDFSRNEKIELLQPSGQPDQLPFPKDALK